MNRWPIICYGAAGIFTIVQAVVSAIGLAYEVPGLVSLEHAFKLTKTSVRADNVDAALSEVSMGSLASVITASLMVFSALLVFSIAAQPALHNGHKASLDAHPEVKNSTRVATIVVLIAGAAVLTERMLNGLQLLPHILVMRDPGGGGSVFPTSTAAGVVAATLDGVAAAEARSVHFSVLFTSSVFDAASGSLLFDALQGSKWASLQKTGTAGLASVPSILSLATMASLTISRVVAVASPSLVPPLLIVSLLLIVALHAYTVTILWKASQAELREAEVARVKCLDRFDATTEWRDRTVRSRALISLLATSVLDVVVRLVGLALFSANPTASAQTGLVAIDICLVLTRALMCPTCYFYVTISARTSAESAFQSLAVRHEEEARRSAQKLIIRYVCHEVRVPLNSIALGMELLADRIGVPVRDGSEVGPLAPHVLQPNDLEACRETLGHMTTGASAMSRVLNDVLQVEAIERGQLALIREPFRPAALLSRVQDTFSPAAAKRGVHLDCAVDLSRFPDACGVMGDCDRLSQVCSNLVSNAVKFTPAGKAVHVRMAVKPSTRTKNSPRARRTQQVAPIVGPASQVIAVRPANAGRHLDSSSAASTLSSMSTSTVSHSLFSRMAPRAVTPLSEAVLEVEVEDEGVGIDPGDVDKLFKPFHQLQSGARFKQHSTGLGLSICRGIVELHGGKIALCSDGVGRGATFKFWVPVTVTAPLVPEATSADEKAQPQPPDVTHIERIGSVQRSRRTSESQGSVPTLTQRTPRARALAPLPHYARPSSTQLEGSALRSGTPSLPLSPRSITRTPEVPETVLTQKQILVVDDVAGNRFLLQRLLERMGHTVESVENGREGVDRALEMVSRTPEEALPLLVLMDGNMPVLDGVSATRELLGKSAPGHVIVVGVTGNAHDDDRKAFIDAGASEVVAKPVSKADLARLVRLRAPTARGQDFLLTRATTGECGELGPEE